MRQVFGVLALTLWMGAFEWPVDDPVQTLSFGQRQGATLFPGVELATKSPVVRATHPGQVVFTLDSANPLALPSAMGNFVAMDHEDADGKFNFRTVVSNLPSVVDPKDHTVSRGQVLANFNPSTENPESRVQVFMFDLKEKTVVNPLLFFPGFRDGVSPSVIDMKVEADKNPAQRSSLYARSTLPADYWRLVMEAADGTGEGGPPLGIYSVRVFQAGAPIFTMELDALQARNGRLFLPGFQESYDFIHPEPRVWRIGRPFISAGTNTIEVEIRDKNGNATTRTFTIIGTRS